MKNRKAAIILAAGKGKRMKSDLPKVLHEINGKSMIRYLLETITKVNLDRIVVVVGYNGEMVENEIKDFKTEIVWQNKQLGTGHAVSMAEDYFKEFKGTILVAAGDVPFLSSNTIDKLFEIHDRNRASATCLSSEIDNPTGYGRIIRGTEADSMIDIIEEKDANSDIKKIKEINSGIFCFNSRDLFFALHRIDDNNSQQEYYLTDTIKILRRNNKKCAVCMVPDDFEILGVNSIEQLETLEKDLKKRKKLKENII